MGDVPFHLTVMGKRFFEGTLPALVKAVERLNENLERLAGRVERSNPVLRDPDPTPRSPNE